MKHSPYDTISAIATPLGPGGVGVIRVSGDKAKSVFSRLFISSNGADAVSHKMLPGWLVDPGSGDKVDKVLACFMQAPKSYTGEDVVEFYCHGGMALSQKILDVTLASGARLATRGEFTKRAFLNGKLDLAQAEAVLDLVQAQTSEGAGFAVRQLEGRLSKTVSETRRKLVNTLAELEAIIDFPEDLPGLNYNAFIRKLMGHIEEIQALLMSAASGRVYRKGLASVIVGKPNVGKSCLLNALLEEERAIVTDIPGTTRDSIEETINVNGLPLRLIDTAGIRHPKDRAEEFGVERAERELSAADFVLTVIDASERLDELDKAIINKASEKVGVVVLNKVDLGIKVDLSGLEWQTKGLPLFKTSALYGQGIRELKLGIFENVRSRFGLPGTDAVVINARHKECLERAREALRKTIESSKTRQQVDFLTIDLKDAIVALGEVTGELVSDEVINAIFDQFCVGK